MIKDSNTRACWKLPLFGMLVFLLTLSVAEAQSTHDFGRSVITEVNRAQGEIRTRSGRVIFLSPTTVIYGQGQKYNQNILRIGHEIQTYGVNEGDHIRATRINVYASPQFWIDINRH